MSINAVGSRQPNMVLPRQAELSVVIPAFNAAMTLPRTLSSLACIAPIDRPRVQVIVIDDGSTDQTTEAIVEFADRLSGFIWTPLRQTNRGVAAARNLGLDVVNGEWIMFLDADDELSASPMAELESGKHLTSMVFRVRYRHSNGAEWFARPRTVAANRIADLFSAGNPYPICSLIFRANCLDSRFDESLRYLEDWKFWWDNPRVFANCRNIISGPLATVHIHGANRTSHFEQTAKFRERVARKILEQAKESLSRQQRNNFRLHIGIAKAASGAASANLAIPAIPCSLPLYFKLLLFLVLGSRIRLFDCYR